MAKVPNEEKMYLNTNFYKGSFALNKIKETTQGPTLRHQFIPTNINNEPIHPSMAQPSLLFCFQGTQTHSHNHTLT